MGLFSFLNKNKQDTTGEDRGYYSRADDETIAARARSKRASSAGEPAARRGKNKAEADDPVLPEKKRARRRLVGAVALALAVAVGLPMLLDSEPKSLSSDIAIQIPSKDKAAPLPAPSEPVVAAPTRVAAADALDQREQIVEAPPKSAAPASPAPVVVAAPAVAEVTLPGVKDAPKPEPKTAKAEAKPAEKPAAKPPLKDDRTAVAANDDARALAILEGKPNNDSQKYVLQVAAFASQDKVSELQGKLKDNGIKSFTQKGTAGDKNVIRVRVGPFSREEAEKMRARLDKLGLSGSMIPT